MTSVRAILSRIGDAIEPERVARRRLWEERNRYWDALVEIDGLLDEVTVQHGHNVHRIAHAQHAARVALGVPRFISGDAEASAIAHEQTEWHRAQSSEQRANSPETPPSEQES